MKQLVKSLAQNLGYDITQRNRLENLPGSNARPTGNMTFFLEDLKARGLNPSSILDVGANRAKWSREVKFVFPDASCMLIEPQLEMQSELDLFCQDFPDSQYILAGAGATQQELTLTVWENFAGSSFLPEETDDLKESGKQRNIPIITIDSLIETKKIELPQLVKLDIQGFELEALKGASSLFGATEVFILEVSLFSFIKGQPVFHEVVNFMEKRGYVVYDFAGLSRRPYDGALGQVDVCFVKQNGFLRSTYRWSESTPTNWIAK